MWAVTDIDETKLGMCDFSLVAIIWVTQVTNSWRVELDSFSRINNCVKLLSLPRVHTAHSHWPGRAMASPAERLARADARLQADPFDLSAWEVVLTVADASPLAEGRPLYERFLQQFPCAVCVEPTHCAHARAAHNFVAGDPCLTPYGFFQPSRSRARAQAVQWKALVDSELRARDFVSAEAHLGACLRQCPHLSLWGCYITFVRLTSNDDVARLVEAYELLLDTVGLDVGSVPHWLDYIALLKTNARTEPKLIVRVRGAYQRALVLPLNKLELVWKVRPRPAFSLAGLTSLRARAGLTHRTRRCVGQCAHLGLVAHRITGCATRPLGCSAARVRTRTLRAGRSLHPQPLTIALPPARRSTKRGSCSSIARSAGS